MIQNVRKSEESVLKEILEYVNYLTVRNKTYIQVPNELNIFILFRPFSCETILGIFRTPFFAVKPIWRNWHCLFSGHVISPFVCRHSTVCHRDRDHHDQTSMVGHLRACLRYSAHQQRRRTSCQHPRERMCGE